IVREVEAELGIRRGDIFSSGELYSALERIQRRWPFLKPDRRGRRSPPAPVVRLEERAGGGVQFRSELPFDAKPPAPPGEDGDDFFGDFDEPESHSWKRHDRKRRKPVSRDAWYGFESNTLVVYLRSERSRGAAQWVELLRHTPVTGFAPGLALTLTIFDPG